ncbi:hypothetical protein GBAR_LOCUS10562 [Geodia barretti]|uniref:Uncharacterized protein n=1 Tax=Geodia barretti TaxID=519541 RepID=A0AA35RTE0_GEOBA|nr:hypothetical protein GBAR_LOCUS10562 [Geodia barretti]
MATESSKLVRGTSSNKRSHFTRPSVNALRTESETSLSSTASLTPGSLYGRRETASELQDLLEALDNAREAVQAQLAAHEAESIRRRRQKPLIPHWVTKYLLLMTFLGQTICIALIAGIEELGKKSFANSTKRADIELTGNILLTTLQAAHLFLVLFVSFKVAKQVVHRTASGSLVAQSYLSTVLLFAGLYTLIYRLDPEGWKRVSEGNISSPILLFLRMLFFSVSTATLCGTSVIEPIQWYINLFVGLQMLTSFVYFTSIMSVALTRRRRSRFDTSPARSSRSFTRKIRRFVFGKSDNHQPFTI